MDITPIAARLRVIANNVNALRELGEAPLDEFVSTFFLHAAAERGFQVAIQSALDIGAILLSEAGTDTPTEYRDIFPKLTEIGVLPESLATRLVAMAKFRNVLVHLYLEIEVERLYQYIQHNLEDFDEFATHVGAYLAQLEGPDEDASH